MSEAEQKPEAEKKVKSDKMQIKVQILELAVKELQEQVIKLGKGFGRIIKLERELTLNEDK